MMPPLASWAAGVRTLLGRRLFFTLALALLLVRAAGAGDIPRPDLADLESAVAQQLLEAREFAEARAADPAISAAEKGETWGGLGQLYHAYGLVDAAEACYREAESLSDPDFRWPYLLGYLTQTAGRLEEAVGHYSRALEIVPDVSPALVRLGESYLALDRVDEAAAALRRALGIDRTSAAAEAALAQVALSRKKYGEAVELLLSALDKVPEADRLHYSLALAYRGLGDMEKAREEMALRGPVGVRPADPIIDGLQELAAGERFYLLRGRAAYRSGFYTEAVEAFRQALAARPDSVTARVNLGSALAAAGDTDGAIEEFEEVVRTAPGNVTAYFNLGSLYARAGETERALDNFLEAARLAPSDPDIRLKLAEQLAAAGRGREALVHFAEAIEMDPGSDRARAGEANVLAGLGRFSEARRRLEEAFALLPNSGLIAHSLALVLAGSPDLELRDGERALDLASRVYTANPTAGHAQTLAMALAELGRCEEAAQLQEQAVSTLIDAGSSQDRIAWLQRVRDHYAGGPPCRYPQLPGRAGGEGTGDGE